MTEKQATPTPREHHWDMLRAALMLLGIPFHVFMSYRAGQVWIVQSGEGAAAYTYAAEFIHLFRMPAFFVVAGYFAALLLARREAGAWLKGRMTRLAIPFVTCLLLLNPVMNLFCELSVYPPAQAWRSFLYNSATSGGYWVRHLWFIIVLLYFCAIAALCVKARPSWKAAVLPARIDRRLARRLLPVLVAVALATGLWEAVAVEAFYMAGLATNLPQQILRLDEVIQYAPWFLMGVVLARAPMMREELYRFSAPMAAIAALATGASLILMGHLGPMQGRFLATIAALFLTQCAIAACKQLADRPHRPVMRLVDASFAIYLFHMPVIIGLVLAGKYLAMPLGLKAGLVLAAAFALSWGAWAVVSRSRVLLFLFDGRTQVRGAGAIPPSPVLYPYRRCDPRPSLP
ncbi:glucan biosynthesis protein [Sphingobium jiangsuense]|nr:glucan biosynthesis protein [Sphingobium jiangsuense]